MGQWRSEGDDNDDDSSHHDVSMMCCPRNPCYSFKGH